jgi:hypothetical protein
MPLQVATKTITVGGWPPSTVAAVPVETSLDNLGNNFGSLALDSPTARYQFMRQAPWRLMMYQSAPYLSD